MALSRVSSTTSSRASVGTTSGMSGSAAAVATGGLKRLGSSLRGLGSSSGSGSGAGANVGAGASGGAGSSSSSGGSGSGGGYVAPTLRGATKAVACAVWWPSSGLSSGSGSTLGSNLGSNLGLGLGLRERRVEGEIVLPRELVPTFGFGGFCVSVSVCFLSFFFFLVFLGVWALLLFLNL